jgi:imidazolonepropionase-like amidohydrolase
MLGFTSHEAIIAATAGVAKLFMRENELGKIQSGFYADCILVDGNPLEDITVLQDHDRLNVIIINGRVHKAGRKEYVQPPIAGQDHNAHPIVPDFPEVKKEMQKNY